MRASVNKDDPGYNPAYVGAKVFLDGVEISRVITADEEKRFVLTVCADETGCVILNADRTEVQTEYRYGAVRIDLPAQQLKKESA